MVKVGGIIWLGLVFLSISTSILAEEEASEKPEDWDRRLEMLRSVPYLAFPETRVVKGDTGVVFYDPEKAYNGYNFYCTLSSGEAFLLDMNGSRVHRWSYSSRKNGGEDVAIMLENGDLVVIRKFVGLLRLSWDSELIWRRELDAHHDVAPAPDGSFYVIIREIKEHRGLSVNLPAIVHVASDGEEISRWSTYDHLAEIGSVLDSRSFLDAILDSALAGRSPKGHQLDEVRVAMRTGRHNYDYFHMNTISILPATLLGEKDPRFQRGNLLICFRNVNQIAVLEKGTYRVQWAWGEGELQWPHHPTMLESGHILIFDNGIKRNYSRVVELDPVAESIVWEYVAQPPEDFYSFSRGSAQRLPNGNTLICESDRGRVFEVTREGEVVWTWLNPVGPQVRRDGRRQAVYRMFRLPVDQVDRLLGR